ncbi:hypothetical protein MMC09_000525 [Bachmanniomyces sp. S44760]|nr:hypothetical protein [Bachmanniomyces sp. S44760]
MALLSFDLAQFLSCVSILFMYLSRHVATQNTGLVHSSLVNATDDTSSPARLSLRQVAYCSNIVPSHYSNITITGVPDEFPASNAYTFDYYLPPPNVTEDALLPRGGSRGLFITNDYRLLAALNGILVLYLQGKSRVGNLETVPNNFARTREELLSGTLRSSWSADHIFELQLLPRFFRSHRGVVNGVNWDSIWSALQHCEDTNERATVALNNLKNLIGIPRRLNELKGQLFAGQLRKPHVRGWKIYFEAEAEALTSYLAFFQLEYVTVARRIAQIIQNVHESQGAASTSSAASPHDIYLEWAENEFQTVLNACLQAQGQAKFRDPSSYDQVYQQDDFEE